MKKLAVFLLGLPYLAGVFSPAAAQIAYRSASSAYNANQRNISFVDIGNTRSANGGPIQCRYPGTWAAGDLLLCVVETKDNVATSMPSGWNLLIGGTSGSTHQALVFWKFAAASDNTTPTISHSGGNSIISRMLAFRNVDTSNPFDATPSLTHSPSDWTTEAAAITTSTVGAMLVFTAHIANNNSGIFSMPSGWTNAFTSSTSQGTDSSIEAWYRVMPNPGTSGTVTATRFFDVAVSSGGMIALRPSLAASGISLTKPAGTASGDLLLASLGVRPEQDVVSAPAGWSLLRRTTQLNGGVDGGALLTFYKVATASEPASYPWYVYDSTNSNEQLTGGMAAFSGVDPAAPINVEGGNTTPSSTSHTANAISTTVANTMLVSSHMFLSARNWTPSTGMTEIVDRASGVSIPNAVGVSLEMAYASQAAVGSSGSKTAKADGDADTGAAHLLALKPLSVASTIGAFNAYETTTAPANAAHGVIQTKVAGASYSLALAALNTSSTAVNTGFNGNVTVQVVGLSSYSGAVALDSGGCPVGATVISAPAGTFAISNGRTNVTLPAVANAWPYAKVKISYTWLAGTVSSCSEDAFAIRPASLTSLAQDSNWTTPGTTRTLNALTDSATPTHKAGQPFRLALTAYNAASPAVATSNYAATSLSVQSLSPLAPATVEGTLTPGEFSGSGTIVSTTANYDEVGAFSVSLYDSLFAQVDGNDGTPADCTGLWVCSSTFSVGRFVPDHFDVSAAVLTPTCAAGGLDSFTYTGAPMTIGFVLTAQNANNETTWNYAGTLAKLNPATTSLWPMAPTANGPAMALGAANVPASPGLPTPFSYDRFTVIGTSGSWTSGVATVSATATFNRANNSAAEIPYADFKLGIAPRDSDGVGLAAADLNLDADTESGSERTIIGTTQMRFGRLRLSNAFGSEKLDLKMSIAAQYWSGNSWVLNGDDSCTSLPASAFFLLPRGLATTSVSGAAVTLSGGSGNVILTAPGAGKTGSVDIAVNLGASGSQQQSCLSGSGGTGGTAANLPWLRSRNGNCVATFDRDPSARATFGIYSPEGRRVIHVRELF